jgi:hypothetical protein
MTRELQNLMTRIRIAEGNARVQASFGTNESRRAVRERIETLRRNLALLRRNPNAYRLQAARQRARTSYVAARPFFDGAGPSTAVGTRTGAEIANTMKAMNTAATKIQKVFRGMKGRQSAAKVKANANARARANANARAKANANARARANANARAKAKINAETKARANAQAKAKAKANEEKARALAQSRANVQRRLNEARRAHQARNKAATKIQAAARGFRTRSTLKKFSNIKSQLEAIRGNLTNAEVNRLSKLIRENALSGLSSSRNMSFFIQKFPNKTHQHYKNRAQIFKNILHQRGQKALAKHLARKVSAIGEPILATMRRNERTREIQNLTKLVRQPGGAAAVEAVREGQKGTGQLGNIVVIKELRRPIQPLQFAGAQTLNHFIQMIGMMSVNNQRFRNAVAFVQSQNPNSPPPPNAPVWVKGMKPSNLSAAKRQYESNLRNWLKTAASEWWRTKR